MKLGKQIWTLVSITLILSAWVGCKQDSGEAGKAETGAKAIAVLHPLGDSDVTGTVTFTRVENGIQVMAAIRGLEPGLHGFHIHEFGDCSAPDGKSAGGHFNPEGAFHGGPMSAKRHVGDMGNITADASGQAQLEVVDSQLELEGPNSIIGRAVVVHRKADDLTSQPSGAAGARIACGVIGLADK
jgi:Cu-Zn family superoxide dismutase